jgi:hypothetical protein
MASSSTTQSLVDQLREEGRRRGLDSATIEMKLQQAGYVQGAAQSAPAGGGLGQMAGVIGRGAMQGLGALHDMTTGAPARIGAQVAGMPQDPSGVAGANMMGLPQPQTPGQRVAMAAAEGAGMSAGMPGLGAGMAAVGAGASGAGQMAAESGAGPLGQMAASLVVGAGFPLLKTMLSGGIKSALAGAASRREAAKQSLALVQAGNPNAAVTLGQVTQRPGARSVEGFLRNAPGAGGVFRSTMERQADEMAQRGQGIADDIGRPVSAEIAGATVKRGIEEGFMPRFRATQATLEEQVAAYVPPTTPVMPQATAKLIAAQDDMAAMARELSDDIVSPKFASVLNHLDEAVANSPDGGIPFTVMRELRSRLGAMLSGDELVADINLRDVKRLYGALSDDMAATVEKVGGEPGRQAWLRATNHWKAGQERIQNVLDPLVRKRTPEQVMNAMMSGTREGATALRSTMRSLAPVEKRLVASNVLREMGKAPPGAQNAAGDLFSPEHFLTSWNRFSPEARSALFEGIDPKITQNLNLLAKAIDVRKQAGKVLYNPSGTAPNTMFWSIFNGLGQMATVGAGALAGTAAGGGVGGAMGAVLAPTATAVGANILARKVFTNPRMIQWLVGTTKKPFGAMAQELAILAKDAQKWPDEDRQVALDFAKSLGSVDWRAILLASAAADATATR